MGIEITRGFGMAAKTCDVCKTSAAAIFCRADSAFMCLNCDARIHWGTHHARVRMCEVCEQAPAAVTCKADAASLCVTCDADIHSANPLARRHERVPVEPFFDSADSIVKSSPFSFLVPTTDHTDCQQEDVTEPGSWLLPDPNLNPKLAIETNKDVKYGEFFFSEMDPFIDFEYHNMFQVQHDHNSAMDSVVPVQTKPVINNENCFEVDFGRSKPPTVSYHTPSLSHSVSSRSLDVGVVPDGSDMLVPFGRTMTDSSGAMSGTTTSSTQASGLMDREARVLRYREKRKNRKFEKTIRYASRKAYAETRPRIKGRFAKRSTRDVNNNVVDDIMFNSTSADAFMCDTQFGLVPSF